MPPGGFGAVEKVWCALGRAFAAKGHEVTIIGRSVPSGLQTEPQQGVRIVGLPGSNASGRIALDLLKDFLYALRIAARVPRSDVVVTNTFWAPVLLALLKPWKGRVVVHVARFPKGQMGLYRGADALQAISSAVARAIREQTPGVGDKVRVLGYPVDSTVFTSRDAPSGAGRDASIVYVGRVHPEKGLHLLVKSFRRVAEHVPRARLEIVGPIAESQGGGGAVYKRKLEMLARDLSVSFRDPLSDERELARVYLGASCFCYPSLAERGEAFGRAVLEAMACGVPCIVSRLECFSDFARHNEEVLMFDHRAADAEERLAEAICSVLADESLARRLSVRARETASRYAIEPMADAYLDMFRSIADGKLA
jgi:glycosyltransferase involved in cell wall biosynthesis